MIPLEFQRAIEVAMRGLGMTGELDISTEGERMLSWIGEPGPEDVIVEITVKPMPAYVPPESREVAE